MMMKKNIPLSLLENIQPKIDQNSTVIKSVMDKNSLIKLIDLDTNSDCYYTILRTETSKGKPGYVIEFKPASRNNPSANRIWADLQNVVTYFEIWVDLINSYNSVKTVHDDPILKQFEEEFYNDFKIIDEDSKSNRFNFSQQILLIGYIENVVDFISSDELKISPEQKNELSNVANSIKDDIATESKEKVIKKLSSFWAKVRKTSIKACDFVIKEFAKEFIKETVKAGMTIDWAHLPKYIDHITLIGK